MKSLSVIFKDPVLVSVCCIIRLCLTVKFYVLLSVRGRLSSMQCVLLYCIVLCCVVLSLCVDVTNAHTRLWNCSKTLHGMVIKQSKSGHTKSKTLWTINDCFCSSDGHVSRVLYGQWVPISQRVSSLTFLHSCSHLYLIIMELSVSKYYLLTLTSITK